MFKKQCSAIAEMSLKGMFFQWAWAVLFPPLYPVIITLLVPCNLTKPEKNTPQMSHTHWWLKRNPEDCCQLTIYTFLEAFYIILKHFERFSLLLSSCWFLLQLSKLNSSGKFKEKPKRQRAHWQKYWFSTWPFLSQEDRSDLWTPKDIWMNEGIKKEIRWKSVDGGMRVKDELMSRDQALASHTHYNPHY